MDRLTNKQEAFVQALIAGKSQREAYRASYHAGRMGDATVDVKASELLKVGKVSVRFTELQDKVRGEAEKSGVASAVEVLEELSHIAMGTKTFPAYDMFGKEHQNKPNLAARIKALELLGKKYAMFTDKTEQSGETTVRVILEGEAGELAQ